MLMSLGFIRVSQPNVSKCVTRVRFVIQSTTLTLFLAHRARASLSLMSRVSRVVISRWRIFKSSRKSWDERILFLSHWMLERDRSGRGKENYISSAPIKSVASIFLPTQKVPSCTTWTVLPFYISPSRALYFDVKYNPSFTLPSACIFMYSNLIVLCRYCVLQQLRLQNAFLRLRK